MTRPGHDLDAEHGQRSRGAVVGALLVVASLVAIVAVVRAGADGPRAGGAGTAEAADAGHIHGLGVNPRDRSLFVASHNGLFRVAAGTGSPAPVGTPGQDVMGFSVVGPDRFLGSGHPGPGQDLPGNLGLIASRDAGRSFTPISLLGEADFHVLRSAGRRVYGADSSGARLLVSGDGGRSWSPQAPPADPFDLAPDPGDPDRVLAATERGLFVSADAGRQWRRVSSDQSLLGWAEPARLFLLDADGAVRVSADGGKTSRPAGQIDGEPVAFTVQGSELFVALADNRVKRSRDGGRSWSLVARL